MLEVYVVRQKCLFEKTEFSEILSYIPLSRQNRLNNFIKMRDRQNTAIAEVLVRIIISNKLNLPNKDICIDTTEYGKPFLRNVNNFHFNISHSNQLIVCAINTSPVGIDVEEITPVDFNIAKHYFSQEEYHNLLSKSEGERLNYFYDLWTLKESYIKATGKGHNTPINSITFEINDDDIRIKNNPDYFFKQYNIWNDYKISSCTDNNFFSDKIFLINSNNLVQFKL